MDQYSLQVFLTMANTLHFGRSGQECNLSPSAVSRSIQRLEEELGTALFLRDNRRVELTSAGTEFRRYAIETLEGWNRLRSSFSSGSEGLSGEIRIYSSVAASYTVLADLLLHFRQQHPDVHIRLQTGDPALAIERIQGDEADIAIAALPASLPRTLVFKPVATTPLLFICPTVASEAAAVMAKPPIPWAKVPLVLSESGLSRKRADAWFRAAGVKPNIYAEVSGHEAILSMVTLGFGVGIIPRIVLDRFALEGEVRVLDIRPPLEPYILGLCAHKRRLESELVKAFWAIT